MGMLVFGILCPKKPLCSVFLWGKYELHRLLFQLLSNEFLYFICFKGLIEPFLLNLQIHINVIAIHLGEENVTFSTIKQHQNIDNPSSSYQKNIKIEF